MLRCSKALASFIHTNTGVLSSLMSAFWPRMTIEVGGAGGGGG